MGFIDDAKDVAETAARKIKDGFEDTVDRVHDKVDEVKALKARLDHLGCAIPTLYKQYSELCEPGGVQFMDFGIDPDFNHCIDGLVWVDVSRIKAHKRARYIGQPARAESAG